VRVARLARKTSAKTKAKFVLMLLNELPPLVEALLHLSETVNTT